MTGVLTDTELRATAVPVSGPLTDTQLRATPVPVSGTVTANAGTNLNTSLLALESGGNLAGKDFATQTTLAALNAKVTAVNTGAVVVSSSALPTGASTLAEQQTQTASLSVMDDWDESDRAKVNIIVGNAGVTGNTGTVDDGTQRVTLATNVALPAGTNAIGKLSANDGASRRLKF